MDDEIKKLVEAQNKAFEAFKEKHAAEIKAGTDEAKAATQKVSDELAKISKDLKSKLEEIETLAARKAMGDGQKGATPEMVEYKSGLFGYIRTGEEKGLRDLEKKAMTSGTNPDGGYTVHPEYDTAIDRVARRTIAMRQIATVRQINSRSLKKLVTTSGASVGGWGNENTTPSATGIPALAELEFTPGTLWAEPQVSRELLEDSDINIESYLADEVGIAYAEQENGVYVTGSGVNKPKGWQSYSIVADASYAWGSIGYIASGGAGAFASTNPTDNFINLMHALKPVYRPGAVWVMNDATLGTVRKFKDGQGNYILMPSKDVVGGFTEMLLGKPIVSDDDMPVVASNSYSVAFGDFKRGYLIVERTGTQVIRDELTAKPNVKFYHRRRVGGGVQNFEAIKVMKMASS
jgi:HK97 family phage major capsid protein